MRHFIRFISIITAVMAMGSFAVSAQVVHIVQRGETLFSIAALHNTTFDAIAAANNMHPPYIIHAGRQLLIGGSAPAPASSGTAAAPPAASTTLSTYIVRGGDTLGTIAAVYNTNFFVLAQMNGLADPNVLYVGQVLQVPAPAAAPAPAPAAPSAPAPAAPSAPTTTTTTGTHTVQRGESLAIIAARYGTNYIVLAEMNGLADPNVLRVGQVLQVPGATSTSTSGSGGGAAPAPAAPAPASTANTSGFELGGQALSFSHPGHMHNARMIWVKRQIKWHGEPASNFQHVINAAKGNGFKVLLSVIGEPGQIAANPGQYYQSYANFLAGLAAGGADAIEVWNEMNIDREWPSGSISGANYTQMLSAAYHAIKGANSGTMVISGAPAPTGYYQGCSVAGGDDDCYIRQMAAAGAAQYMDCVGVHYNSGIVPPDATSGAPVGSSGHYSWYYPRMISLYSSVFPGKPLCFTELGYLTGDGIGALPGGFAWAADNTLAEQASWLAGAVTRGRNSGVVRMLIVWNVDATHWSADPQAGYAIVRPGGACPACDTLRAAMGG